MVRVLPHRSGHAIVLMTEAYQGSSGSICTRSNTEKPNHLKNFNNYSLAEIPQNIRIINPRSLSMKHLLHKPNIKIVTVWHRGSRPVVTLPRNMTFQKGSTGRKILKLTTGRCLLP